MRQRSALAIGSALLIALASSGLVSGPAQAAPTPQKIGTVVSRDCSNLGITIPLSASQKARAQAMLPKGFRLTNQPTLLVETSQCAGARVNGTAIGAFKLSEAALSVHPPRAVTSKQLPNIITEHIFVLSQLDTNALLSSTKRQAGYRTELTAIALDRGMAGSLPRVMRAKAGGALAPSTARAEVGQLLPTGVEIGNPGVVYQLWTADSKGRYVVTTNSNLRISSPALGTGTVTVQRGTTLHHLLGTRTSTGVAFAGRASGFVNDTYVFSR